MSGTKLTRVVLLDDHEFILQGMSHTVNAEQDMQVVATYRSGRELRESLSTDDVDVLVMDYSLGPDEIDGLNLIRTLRIRFPGLALVVISATHTPATVALALRYGARGFVGKELDPQQLTLAIRTVALGRIYLHPDMSAALVETEIGNRRSGRTPSEPGLTDLFNSSQLSAREHDVLRCCLEGMSVTQIAEKFSRSIKTISTQKQAAYRKLGLRSDNELFKIRHQLDVSE